MSNYQEVTLNIKDGIAIIMINRPKALNALNDGVFKDLIQIFTKDLDASAIKGVIITGSGDKAFVAGADIKEFLSLDNARARELSKRGHDIFTVIENFPLPVIAAVNGFALGGGCELAMACHMRVAGTHARFGQPEVNLGILPGYGGTQRLAQLIGKGRAFELILTGDMINADKAKEYGLVNHVCPSGEEVASAAEIINKTALKAPLAIAESIRVINAGYAAGKDGFAEEIKAFGRLAETEDFKEGAAAFIEKRRAEWKRK